jgi:hypothetical protein
MNMFGDNHNCPIRITSFIGYDLKLVEDSAQILIEKFGWQIHSRATLRTVDTIIYSIILFNTKGTIIEELTKNKELTLG